MAKKRPNDRPPIIVSRHGEFRFQRGMITARLLRAGLSMEQAFETSRALRTKLLGRGKITTDELKDELWTMVEKRHGFVAKNQKSRRRTPLIRSGDQSFPFSRGDILRRLVASGLEVEEAILVTDRVNEALRKSGQQEVQIESVHHAVCEVLYKMGQPVLERRYRVTNFSKEAPSPLLLFIGGAGGTGKSTLATELAYRLGIHKIVNTDLVRETMRTVLSAAVVPGLHDHSFRGIIQGRQVLSDPRERVLAGFRQQAAQVMVGLRGVIARAIRENTSMIIEGVHILPPYESLVPPGLKAYVAGITLAVASPKTHKKRFVKRAAVQRFRAQGDYLDAFQSVRWVHDDLIRLADENDSLMLHNVDTAETVTDVLDYLSQVLPEDRDESTNFRPAEIWAQQSDVKTLLLILDGLADEPIPVLGGLTPLEAANTPTIWQLAGAGGQGQLRIRPPDDNLPDTALGLTTLLYDEHQAALGRGLLEALGAGIPLSQDMVLFRGNLATVGGDDVIVDRRAGRIRTGVADLLDGLQDIPLPGGISGHVYPGHEHRVVVVLKGPGVSAAICDTDPGIHTVMEKVTDARPSDATVEAARTAKALTALLQVVRTHLAGHPVNVERAEIGLHPANAILTRGAESASILGTIPHPRRTSAVISACPTARGVARAGGLAPISTARMTGNLDSDLDAKLESADRLLHDHDFVAIHFKGTDIAAHDRQPLQKRDYIARVDAALGEFFERLGDRTENLRIVVTGDHGTSSLTGVHLKDPVPLLLGKWDPDAEPAEFNESSAAYGALGLIEGSEFADLLWSSSDS